MHCNASNLVLEIMKHEKIWGTICTSVSHSKFWGIRPLSPVIYAHVFATPRPSPPYRIVMQHVDKSAYSCDIIAHKHTKLVKFMVVPTVFRHVA